MSLSKIKARIADAEKAVGRAPGAVRLVAISKKQPLDRVRLVLEEGHRMFGENRVQEAAEKWPGFRETYPGIVLHLVGPLQSNKAREALSVFDVIETLDRPKLASTLARLAQEEGRCPPLYVQVNTGEEPQKTGIRPADADAFIAEARAMDLPVQGVMAIPPQEESPEVHFAMLGEIAERNGLPDLSMGMSADFETAIRLGATHVRVGAALFGPRP